MKALWAALNSSSGHTLICPPLLWLYSLRPCLTLHSLMHSNLSLASEDADCPESVLVRTCGSFSDSSRTRPCEKPSMTEHCHPQDVPFRGDRRCPASRSGSSSDVPVLLINGVPQPDPDICKTRLENELDLTETISGSSSRPCLPHSASQQKMLFSFFYF